MNPQHPLYDVIIEDPPWHYGSRKAGAERKDPTRFGGGAEKHYPLMKDKDLMAFLPPLNASLAAENCALFMWATMPRLDFAIEVMKASGFRYVTTAFVWVKPSSVLGLWHNGPGYYTASNAEIVILGIKGKMPPATKMIDSVIMKPKTRHSEKPVIVQERIERMYPDAKRIELFARQPREGWDVWGNEVQGVQL